ncbi:hypothetical protein Aduo_012577 [Ancylostoma duodenale]
MYSTDVCVIRPVILTGNVKHCLPPLGVSVVECHVSNEKRTSTVLFKDDAKSAPRRFHHRAMSARVSSSYVAWSQPHDRSRHGEIAPIEQCICEENSRDNIFGMVQYPRLSQGSKSLPVIVLGYIWSITITIPRRSSFLSFGFVVLKSETDHPTFVPLETHF